MNSLIRRKETLVLSFSGIYSLLFKNLKVSLTVLRLLIILNCRPLPLEHDSWMLGNLSPMEDVITKIKLIKSIFQMENFFFFRFLGYPFSDS